MNSNEVQNVCIDDEKQIRNERIKKSFSKLGLVYGVVVLFIILAFIAPNFLTMRNMLNVLRAISFTGIIACGMTFMIISGDIDVSVGSATAFASSFLGILVVNQGWGLWAAIVMVLITGTIIHILMGSIRVFLKIPSFIVTLSMYMSLRGLARLITGAWSITPFPESFYFWGQGNILKIIPVPVVFMAVVFIITFFISNWTIYGRSVYSIGGNEEASKLSGIAVSRTRLITFALIGFLSALCGILISSRIGAGSSKIAVGMEFQVIAAVILGGTSLSGGSGKISGTFLGVIFMGLLSNGMVLLGVDPFAQEVASGAIILLAVVFSEVTKQRKRKVRIIHKSDSTL
jgi:simple sugar transport system permease protein